MQISSRRDCRQEPITWSLYLRYILESTFLFLEQCSPQASINSQENILYCVVCCVVLCYGVLYYIVLCSIEYT